MTDFFYFPAVFLAGQQGSTFVIFCSRAKELPESYKRYLVNGLRVYFEMPGTPIRLIVKSSENPYQEKAKKRKLG